MHLILGSYSRNEKEHHQGDNEMNVDPESGESQNNGKPIRGDFGSLLNTNSRENIEITAETARINKCENTSRVSTELYEMKRDLNCQIQEAKDSEITKEILPSS